ncbi:hypothetical protein ACOMHN_053374 [Nucella lapillus]
MWLGWLLSRTPSNSTHSDSSEPLPQSSEGRGEPPDTAPKARVTADSNSTCSLWSCRGQCGSRGSNGTCFSCYCDALCVLAGDCCWDYFSHCHNLSHPDLIARHIERTLDVYQLSVPLLGLTTDPTPLQGSMTDPIPLPGPTPLQGPTTDPTPLQGPTTDPTPLQGPTTDPSPLPGPTTDPTPLQGPKTDSTPLQGPTTDPSPLPGPTTDPTPLQGPTTDPSSLPGPRALLSRYGQCTPSPWDSFWAVTRCPAPFADVVVRARCEGPSAGVAPVTHGHWPSVVFANRFCALCHGLGPNVTTPWPLMVRCRVLSNSPTVEDLKRAFRKNLCIRFHQPPLMLSNDSFQPGPRLCRLLQPDDTDQRTLLSMLNGSRLNANCTRNEALFCLAYYYPTSGKSPAKNSYCSKCGINDTFSGSCRACGGSSNSAGMSGPIFELGIGKLFNFRVDEPQVELDGQTVPWRGLLCGTDEVYDHHDKVCRQLTCFTGYRLQGGQCVPVSVRVDGHSQLLANGTRLLSVLVTFADTDTMRQVKKQLEEKLSGYFNGQSEELNFHLVDSHIAKVSMNVSGNFSVTELFKSYNDLNKLIPSSSRDRVNITVSNVREELDDVTTVCPDGASPVTISDANVTEENGESLVAWTSQGVRQLYPLGHLPFSIAFVFSNAAGARAFPVVRAVLCEQALSNSSLSCPAQQHLRNETSLVNGSLVVLSSGQVFGEDQYEINGDTVRVCSRYKNRNSLWDRLLLLNFDPAQKIVMHVLSAFSVLSLVFVLSVYCFLPELRTLPGRLLMCVVTCLLVGHVTLNVDVKEETACYVLGVVSHYVWLACFTWMSAMAVHMARTFTCVTLGVRGGAEEQRRWVVVSALCWGLPLVGVGLCVTLDTLRAVPVAMQYGQRVCGWIGNGQAIVFAFLLPVGLSLLLNLAALLATVVGIERTARLTRMARGQMSEGRRAVVYVKMSAAVGMTWVLGVVSGVAGVEWLQWVYLVVNSLQGAFLATAYILNHRVAAIIRNKMAAVFKQEFSSGALQTQKSSTKTKSTSETKT